MFAVLLKAGIQKKSKKVPSADLLAYIMVGCSSSLLSHRKDIHSLLYTKKIPE
jgi:hypothetical protein